MKNIKERVEDICKDIGTGLLEREECIKILVLAALSGENVFLLGEPGIAKSLLAQRLHYMFKHTDDEEHTRYFEYLMNQFSEPDQLFGPLDLKALKEGNYIIKTKGYLPDALVVFLDEIWKANPSIQNTLLGVLNEHKFNNGNKVQDIPLKSFVCASNELPAKEVEGNHSLEALFDRIIVRLHLFPLQKEENFQKIINTAPSKKEIIVREPIEWKGAYSELEEIRKGIDEQKLGLIAESTIGLMRQRIRDYNSGRDKAEEIFVSDRRWQKIARLIKAASYINGHTEADIIDTRVMIYTLWNTPQQQIEVEKFWHEIIQDKIFDQSDMDDLKRMEKEVAYYQGKHSSVENNFNLEFDDDGFVCLEHSIDILPLGGNAMFGANTNILGDTLGVFAHRTALSLDIKSINDLKNNASKYQKKFWQPRFRDETGNVIYDHNVKFTVKSFENSCIKIEKSYKHKLSSHEIILKEIKNENPVEEKVDFQFKKHETVMERILSLKERILDNSGDYKKQYSENFYITEDILGKIDKKTEQIIVKLDTFYLALREEKIC